MFAYRERVCLVQISTRRNDYILDPFTITDIEPLRELFASPSVEKVFHAAEYDIMCLKRDYGFTFANLFDTMIAARILGIKAIGLANLIEEHFGVKLDKRFQRADWSVRPIPPDQLEYARHDTHYLPRLRDLLLADLKQKDALEEAQEVFVNLSGVQPPSREFDPEGYWFINAAQDLSRREMAILRELYLWREHLASERDLPPFKVVTDEGLVNIVLARPAVVKDLAYVRGVNRHLAERYGRTLLSAFERGENGPLPRRPRRAPAMDAATLVRYNALRDWRRTRATERGVESDVILPKEAVIALSNHPPQTMDDLLNVPGLGPWKRARYGADILALLSHVDVPDEPEAPPETNESGEG